MAEALHTRIKRIRALPLQERIDELLGALSMVSEAPGASVILFSPGSGDHESKPPTEVEVKRRLTDKQGNVLHDQEPPQSRHLHDWYVWAFANAKDDVARMVLCVRAEIDLGWRQKALPGEDEDGQKLTPKERQEAIEEQEQREEQALLKQGEGIHVIELATLMEWRPGWVRTVRVRNGREPEYGRVRPNWRELSDDERYVLVYDCKQRRLTQREAASEIGVGVATVNKYWLRAVA